jgi:type II secretory pathway component GspD/PulD (secretin)
MRSTLLALALLFGGAAQLTTAQPPPGLPRTVRVFALKNADAEKLKAIIDTIFGRQGVTVAVDARTNSLVIAGDADSLEEVRKLVARLDEPGKRK